MSDNERVAGIAEDTVKKFAIANNLVYVSKLGSGGYGDVFKLRVKKTGILKAAKIVTPPFVMENEIELWPVLKCENVLPVEKITTQPDDTIIFLMPFKATSMFQIIEDDTFRAMKESLAYLKKWIHDISKGLKYLHGIDTCHLDLKPDNVLIGTDGTAVISDFTLIKKSTDDLYLSDLGLPDCYQPPEVDRNDVEKQHDGFAFDVWSLGIVLFEALTIHGLLRRIVDKIDSDNLMNFLESFLNEKNMACLMKENLSHCECKQRDVKNLVSFLQCLLVREPDCRPTLPVILKHDLFQDVTRVSMFSFKSYISGDSENPTIQGSHQNGSGKSKIPTILKLTYPIPNKDKFSNCDGRISFKPECPIVYKKENGYKNILTRISNIPRWRKRDGMAVHCTFLEDGSHHLGLGDKDSRRMYSKSDSGNQVCVIDVIGSCLGADETLSDVEGKSSQYDDQSQEVLTRTYVFKNASSFKKEKQSNLSGGIANLVRRCFRFLRYSVPFRRRKKTPLLSRRC